MNIQKQTEAERILRHEKIRVVLYPISTFTFIYGVWLIMFPEILERYAAYTLVNDFVHYWQIGSVLVVLAIILFIAFKLKRRMLLLITSIILLSIWSMFTVAFFLSPPPNTIWLYSALMTYLTFTMTRRV